MKQNQKITFLCVFLPLLCFAEFTAEQIIGIGYQPGDRLALVYSAFDVTSIKTTCLEWAMVESLPPEPDGTHNYVWDEIDSLVIKHQRSGIDEFCIWLGCNCWWATCPHWSEITTKDRRRPLPEYEEDFYEWVYNLVERYDGDGIDDVPGLLYPVKYYMMESEAQQFYFFEGCSYETHVEDYLAVLGIAYRAVKDANIEVQLGLAAVLFPDMFDDFPDTATMFDRLRIVDSIGLASPYPDSVGTRSMRFMRETICSDSIYDFVCFHPLFNWEGLFGQVNFIRSIMDSAGIDKPIFADDAVSGPMFYDDGFRPRLPEVKDSLYNIIGNSAHALHPIVDPWFRANQARSVTKNFVVALSLGVQRMWTETSQDWVWPWLTGMESWAFIGLVDYNWLFPAMSVPRPALRTLRLLKEKFEGYRRITRLPPEEDLSRIYLFRFHDGYRPDMLCIWFENHIDEMPEDDIPETTDVEIDFFPANRRILMTTIITSRIDTIAHTDTLFTTASGRLIIPLLNETPIFIEDIGSIGITESRSLPEKLTISAHPNPFNSSVTIAVDCRGLINQTPTVEIYDVNGRRVAEITPPGPPFTGGEEEKSPLLRGDLGGLVWRPAPSLPSGVYLVRARFDPSTLRQAQGTVTIGGGRGDLDPTEKTATKRIVYLK
jgi:hypothetical protein